MIKLIFFIMYDEITMSYIIQNEIVGILSL